MGRSSLPGIAWVERLRLRWLSNSANSVNRLPFWPCSTRCCTRFPSRSGARAPTRSSGYSSTLRVFLVSIQRPRPHFEREVSGPEEPNSSVAWNVLLTLCQAYAERSFRLFSYWGEFGRRMTARSWSYFQSPIPAWSRTSARRGNIGVSSKPDLKWNRLTQEQDVTVLPVYPGTMLVEPFVEHLAGALRRSMDVAIQRSQAGSSE